MGKEGHEMKIKVMKAVKCVTSVASYVLAVLFFTLPETTPVDVVYKFLVVLIGLIVMAMISGSCLDAMRRR